MSTIRLRVGYGYDVHRLEPGRELVLGGVHFEYPLGLAGHSDADVLLHAVMDALLGAAGMEDIGHRFPNTDEAWKNASSVDMLAQVFLTLQGCDYSVVNVDATVVAEAPRIASAVGEMRRVMAETLRVDVDCVSVKATTAEGTGPEGRAEAMSAHAVVLIQGR